MTRVAAVDCGTNSIRMLIAESGPDGRPVEVGRRLELVRLGQGVDATKQFHPEALARTFAAIDSFAADLEAASVDRVRFVATSAARDAGNRDEFFAGVRGRLGVEAEIISGDEEARLSYAGAVAGVGEVPEPLLVMDIGGGSTELVVGQGGDIVSAISLDIGSVRLRERVLPSDPTTDAERRAATEIIDAALDGSGTDFDLVRTWVGVAGTATSMAAVQLGLTEYDREKVHRAEITNAQVDALADRFLAAPVASLLSLPTLPQRRAEVIGAGSLIASRIAARLRGYVPGAGPDTAGERAVDMIVSESDILDGIVGDLLAG